MCYSELGVTVTFVKYLQMIIYDYIIYYFLTSPGTMPYSSLKHLVK